MEINPKTKLEDLPYGTIIEICDGKKIKQYIKCEGLDGDILFSIKDKGMWFFIKKMKDYKWFKKYNIIYKPMVYKRILK